MNIGAKTFLACGFVYVSILTTGFADAERKAADLSYRGVFRNFSSPFIKFLDDLFYYLEESDGKISAGCKKDTKNLINLATDGDTNALKIFDASGKAASGILEGGVYFLGYYSECVNTVIPRENNPLQSKYCLINLNASTSFVQEVFPQASWLVLSKSDKPPTIGLCVPESCSTEDVQYATNASLHDNFQDMDGSVSVCHRNRTRMFQDPGAVIAFCIFIIFVGLALVGTVLDFVIEQRSNLEAKCILSESRDKTISTTELCQGEDVQLKDPPLGVRCLLAFSFKTNARKIFSTGKADKIACVHGLKFLSMALIILGHTFSFASLNMFFMNPVSVQQTPKSFLTQYMANGTFVVDTFFIIGGTLLAYVTLNQLAKSTRKFPFFYFYFHRYFRLTPLMMAVVIFCAFLLQYMSSGPYWLQSIEMYDSWCRQNGWINALYLHNFINTENMCLSHTWYLAADMQMYIIAPLILIPLHKNVRLGLIVMGLFLFSTFLTTALISGINHYPAMPYINNIVPQVVMDSYYKNVYIKPYCRMGPYIVGIALGAFFSYNKELILRKRTVVFLWCLSIATNITVIYLMWPANQGIIPSNAEATVYSTLARTLWSITISWLMITCFYGYGGFINSILSWSPFIPLSRLTYCAYLIHPVVMNVYYGSTETAIIFSNGFTIYAFLGNICITFLLSILLSMLFESPVMNMEKIILSRNRS